MLSLKTTAAGILGLLAMTATASPIFLPNGQEVDVVILWQEVNRQGNSMALCDLGKCSEFPHGNEWNNAISSMMVTEGFSCIMWDNSNCAGAPLRSDMRGVFDDLRIEGMDDMVGSLMCRQLMM